MKIGVLGCMAERLKEKFLEEEKIVDLVVGPDAYRELPELVKELELGHAAVNVILSKEETYGDISPTRLDPEDSYLWYGGGPKKDFKNAGELQKATAVDFAKLLDLVATNYPDIRIRFSTSNPQDMGVDVLHAMAKHSNICRHIHLPVQSGSSAVLERMNRQHTREEYFELIDNIRKIVPDCALSHDIITGFCGETEEEHQDTLSLMEYVKYDFGYMFAYSDRPGTPAHKRMPDDVPEAIKKRRLQEVIALQNRHSLERMQSYLLKQNGGELSPEGMELAKKVINEFHDAPAPNSLPFHQGSSNDSTPKKTIEVEDDYEYEEIKPKETFSLQENEQELIKKALERHHGKRKYAAEELGISERTLYRKIKQYDLTQDFTNALMDRFDQRTQLSILNQGPGDITIEGEISDYRSKDFREPNAPEVAAQIKIQDDAEESIPSQENKDSTEADITETPKEPISSEEVIVPTAAALGVAGLASDNRTEELREDAAEQGTDANDAIEDISEHEATHQKEEDHSNTHSEIETPIEADFPNIADPSLEAQENEPENQVEAIDQEEKEEKPEQQIMAPEIENIDFGGEGNSAPAETPAAPSTDVPVTPDRPAPAPATPPAGE
ncbi:unnamed protein product [Cyprideis torosa]|uniref:Uncharacterized protein n=1 Tax=Cyprideis torosa TaxID=163714 RepID=A0A7R8WP79_9CRUS|nr:unnamed protein product [Cyprideis torosa]CAG0904813.1 unnamed protein product [Cyprideis torosa]